MKRRREGGNEKLKRAAHYAFALQICLVASACSQSNVKVGADVLIEKQLDMVRGKRVGLITNQTGRLSSGEFLVDVLRLKGVEVVALFSPEHGIRGEAAAGQSIESETDAATGIPVFSLYGKTKKPTPEMLQNVDLLIYDIQDVGARFYTYISTMKLAMEAAAAARIPFIVLDRPNPLGGEMVAGPLMEDSLRSFVGLLPIPVVYGLTCGELAMMINAEHWLTGEATVQLAVVTMEGWNRWMRWEDTGLPWIPPSPNIPQSATTIAYPATCFIEATNVSEGRGTGTPFQVIGAPFVDSERFVSSISRVKLRGASFHPITFTPGSSKFSGKECRGVRLEVTDQKHFQPILTGLHVIQQLRMSYPGEFILNRQTFDRLMGTADVYDRLSDEEAPESIVSSWQSSLEKFRVLSSGYYLYY